MAKIDFINQLRALGINPQEPAADKLYFEWEIPVGKNAGKNVLVGLVVSNDFPANCPSGPHFKSLEDGWIEHPLNIHDYRFGEGWSHYPTDRPIEFYQTGWRYWSRPCTTWSQGERSVKYYLAHVRKILMTL